MCYMSTELNSSSNSASVYCSVLLVISGADVEGGNGIHGDSGEIYLA